MASSLVPVRSLPPAHRAQRAVALLLAALVACIGLPTTAALGAPGGGDEGGLTVTLGFDASDARLTWEEQVVEAGSADAQVAWDLRGLDGAAHAGDVVEVEVVSIEGPGTLDVWSTAAHGRRAVLLARSAPTGAAPASFALQMGRRTEQRWSFDRPGPHRVALQVRAPLAGGGTVAVAVVRTFGAAPDLDLLTEAELAEHRSAPASTGSIASSFGVGSGSSGEAAARQSTRGERVVIADGHVDIGPRIVDGHWRVQLKDDTTSPATWRELADVVLHATDAAKIEVPDRAAYAFLGSPGTPYHLLPQTQQSGLVWPGWNSQDPAVVAAVPGAVTWRLRGVDGPGRFALFLTDSFGDTTVLFDSDERFPQDLEIPRNSHVHGNWAFGAPGVYRLQVEMRAALAEGGTASDVRTLTVAVGDGTDPTQVAPPDDDGSPGQPVGDGDDGPGITITTDLDPDGGSGGTGKRPAGSGGGALAKTGSAIASLLPWALLLLATGLGLRLTARVLRTKNENHS